MAKVDIETRFEALESILIGRKWLGHGEVDALANNIIKLREEPQPEQPPTPEPVPEPEPEPEQEPVDAEVS